MKSIPILRCLDMAQALAFYTQVFDFELKYPTASAQDWVLELVNGEAELMLTRLAGDQPLGQAVYMRIGEVDALYRKYMARGLSVPHRPESPVHCGPVNQTWGMREFYVDDPSGNTLRFGAAIPASNSLNDK
jgi:uncharacterized glyoxalase superfamily protein PhnB